MHEIFTGTEHVEPALAAISEHFRDFCGTTDLSTLAVAADKHGSFVWEAGRLTEGLNRYLTFSLTPDASAAAAQEEPIIYVRNFPSGSERFIASGGRIMIIGEIIPIGETATAFNWDTPNHWVPYRASITALVNDEKRYTSQVHESWIYESGQAIFDDIENGHLKNAWENGWAWALHIKAMNLTNRYGDHRTRSA